MQLLADMLADIFIVFVINVPFFKYMLKILNIYFSIALFLFHFGLTCVGRCQILLENEISIFEELVSRRKHEVLQNILVNGYSDVGFQKTQWTITNR